MSSTKSSITLSPFKQDIDDLINDFVLNDSTSFSAMKKLWRCRNFSYIFQSMPSNSKLPLFMQSLYSHSIGYMANTSASLNQRLAGLYCLYCLYGTQPFKPPFKIYLSLGELKKLKKLVVDAKEHGVRVVSNLVTKMLETNMFLFGAVDLNAGSTSTFVDQLTQLHNDRVRLAYNKLFPDTRLEHFLHMDLGSEFDLNALKKMSTEYAEAKKQAIQEASQVVNVEDIQHISDEQVLIGDVVENIRGNWNAQKEVFYQQTGMNHHPAQEEQQHLSQAEQNDNDDDFSRELELQLYEEESTFE